MPLIRAGSSMGPLFIVVGGVPLMLKDTRQPSLAVTPEKAHFVSTPAKRRSVEPFLNSVNGAHPLLFCVESCTSSVEELMSPETLKPMSHNAAFVTEESVPHT